MAEDMEAEPIIYYDKETDMDVLQERAREWIGALLGEDLASDRALPDLLADGAVLSKLGQRITEIYKIKFGTPLGEESTPTKGTPSKGARSATPTRTLRKTPSWSKKGHWDAIANVASFLKVCRAMGVKDFQMFEPTDVVEKKNLRSVLLCIRVLSLRLNTIGLVRRTFDPSAANTLPLGQSLSQTEGTQGQVEAVVRILGVEGLSAYPQIRAKPSGNSSEEDYDVEHEGDFQNGEQGAPEEDGRRGRPTRNGSQAEDGHSHVLQESNGTSFLTPDKAGHAGGAPKEALRRKAAGGSASSKKHRRRRSMEIMEDVGKRPSSGHKENGRTPGWVTPDKAKGRAGSPALLATEIRAMRINGGTLEPLRDAKSGSGGGGAKPFVLSASIVSGGTPPAKATAQPAQAKGQSSRSESVERRRRPKTSALDLGRGDAAEGQGEAGKTTCLRRRSSSVAGRPGGGKAVAKRTQKSLVDQVVQMPMHLVVGGAVAATFALGALALAIFRPKREYRVKEGDCLAKIAQKAGKKHWKDIHRQNPKIRDPNFILTEDVITL